MRRNLSLSSLVVFFQAVPFRHIGNPGRHVSGALPQQRWERHEALSTARSRSCEGFGIRTDFLTGKEASGILIRPCPDFGHDTNYSRVSFPSRLPQMCGPSMPRMQGSRTHSGGVEIHEKEHVIDGSADFAEQFLNVVHNECTCSLIQRLAHTSPPVEVWSYRQVVAWIPLLRPVRLCISGL